MWGLLPIYWKLLPDVPALQTTSHRVIWSFAFLWVIIALRRSSRDLLSVMKWRTLAIYLVAGSLLAVNWLTYIWAVTSGHVLESSLGYFINPLVNVLLGMLFMNERLRPWQWVSVGVAAAGVLYLTMSYGRLPWIALVLAVSFGLYGLSKKLAPLGALYGLTLETSILFLPALVYLVTVAAQGNGAFGRVSSLQTALLVLTGIVTSVPLLLFSEGARRIPLTLLGVLQYISPTLQFLLGTLVYAEPFSLQRLAGFAAIWGALAIYTAESIAARRREQATQPLPPE